MKHNVTVSPEETKARKDWTTPKQGKSVNADDGIEKTVKELLALRHKMDEDAFKASTLKARIMNVMRDAETLKSKSGAVLATWSSGKSTKTIDYSAILEKYNVTEADINANTKYKVASRTFVIEEQDDDK